MIGCRGYIHVKIKLNVEDWLHGLIFLWTFLASFGYAIDHMVRMV